ncbi:MAG: hypothetical protein ABSF63_03070 [Candidatus Bathyarchaeia archaeon]|jgi:hypothetical protein
MKPKKKKGGLGNKLFVGIIALALVAIIALAVFQSNPSKNETMTTSQASSSPSPLTANDFNITPIGYACVLGINGFKSVTVPAQLQNDKGIAFHYVSATIIFANYTLANGTVITVNQQSTDKSQTYNTTHSFNLGAESAIPNSGVKITQVEFVITAYVQETSEPIIRLVVQPTPGNC